MPNGRGGETAVGAGSPPQELVGGMLEQVLHATPACVGILDTELRYLYVNPTLARLNGLPAEEHLGRTLDEMQPYVGSGRDVLLEVLADGRSREGINSEEMVSDSELGHRHCWRGAYHRLEIDGEVLGVVMVIMIIDGVRREQIELERAQNRLALLDQAATRIGTTLEMETTCAELADFLVPVLADVAGVMMLPAIQRLDEGTRPGPGALLRLRLEAVVPHLQDHLSALGAVVGEDMDYREGAGTYRCVASGQPVVENQLSDEEMARSVPNVGSFDAHRAVGVHSALVVPLTARGHLMGTVAMVRAGNSPPFTQQDVVAAQDVVGRAAISLDNARRYDREHGIALELQRGLLAEPGSPHPGIEVATRYLPAGDSTLVGGDWYDAIQLPHGRTLLAMGDVMGHGVEAAVAMSHYRAMLRVVAAEDLPPHSVLKRLDELITEAVCDRPATCMLVLADPGHGECQYASAGHLPPAALRAEGSAELLSVPVGPPLGTGLGGYRTRVGPCEPGNALLLYTDGLVERRDEDVDQWLTRLTRLRLPADGPLEDLLDSLLARLVPHGQAEDDVAVLAARLHA